MAEDFINATTDGMPVLDRKLFVFSSGLPEQEIEHRHPAVWRYLEEGMSRKVHQAYLCQHREPWYAQERRPPAPIICTYMSRKVGVRHFRFIRNRSRTTAANVYLLLYPRPALAALAATDPDVLDRVWQALTRLSAESLVRRPSLWGWPAQARTQRTRKCTGRVGPPRGPRTSTVATGSSFFLIS